MKIALGMQLIGFIVYGILQGSIDADRIRLMKVDLERQQAISASILTSISVNDLGDINI